MSENLFDIALVQKLYYLLSVCNYSWLFAIVLLCSEFIFIFFLNCSSILYQNMEDYALLENKFKLILIGWLQLKLSRDGRVFGKVPAWEINSSIWHCCHNYQQSFVWQQAKRLLSLVTFKTWNFSNKNI